MRTSRDRNSIHISLSHVRFLSFSPSLFLSWDHNSPLLSRNLTSRIVRAKVRLTPNDLSPCSPHFRVAFSRGANTVWVSQVSLHRVAECFGKKIHKRSVSSFSSECVRLLESVWFTYYRTKTANFLSLVYPGRALSTNFPPFLESSFAHCRGITLKSPEVPLVATEASGTELDCTDLFCYDNDFPPSSSLRRIWTLTFIAPTMRHFHLPTPFFLPLEVSFLRRLLD